MKLTITRRDGTQHEVLYDSEDQHIIDSYSWRVVKCRNTFYVRTSGMKVGGKWVSYSLHRLVMNSPKGIVDHKNRNGLDNRKSNLRSCANSQNQINKTTPTKTSKYKGVSFHKRSGKFEASITVNKKKQYLGLFDSEKAAASAYDEAAKELFADFALTNFIN